MRLTTTSTFAAALLTAVLVADGCGAGSPTPTGQTPTALESASGGPTAGLTATPGPGLSAGPSPSPSAGPKVMVPSFRHVYLIVMENKVYDSVVGSKYAPYIDSLIARYGLATAFYAEAHPSEPNYIAMVSGGLQGVNSDGTYNLAAPSLFDQLDAAGKTWHVYAQAYPGHCYTGYAFGPVADGPGFAGEYARKHNPAISFTSISRNPTLCARITGLAGFDPAAADFEMIVPNQYNDMHSTPPSGTGIGAGDAFLKAFLPSILDSPAFAGSVVFITWDEGSGTDQRVATLVLSPGMTPGYRSATQYSHYSMLRTIEQAWGLPYLGEAARATSMLFPY